MGWQISHNITFTSTFCEVCYLCVHNLCTCCSIVHCSFCINVQHCAVDAPIKIHNNTIMLTHWGRDKMATIFQTIFSNVFSWMKMYEFRLKFHWSLFLRVLLTIFQHWFRTGDKPLSEPMIAQFNDVYIRHSAAKCIEASGPCYLHGLTLIPPWINNKWVEITYSFQNFSGSTCGVILCLKPAANGQFITLADTKKTFTQRLQIRDRVAWPVLST